MSSATTVAPVSFGLICLPIRVIVGGLNSNVRKYIRCHAGGNSSGSEYLKGGNIITFQLFQYG